MEEKQIIDYTDEELKALAEKILEDGQVVLHDQVLSRSEWVEACARIGAIETNDYFMNPPDTPEISIVSGQVDKDGKAIGMFRDQELQWHANGTGRYNFDEIIVGLYCVYECVDTVLTVLNQADAFDGLSDEKKEFYRNIDIQLNNSGPRARLWPKDSDYKGAGENTFRIGQEHYKETVDRRPLIGKHPVNGREYIYFMVPYIVKAFTKDGEEIEDFEAFYAELWEDVIKSKYMFHQVFHVGDLLLMDQLLTIHRRSPIKDKDRQLWRTAFDYSKVINYEKTRYE